MYLPGSGNQPGTHRAYRADGALSTTAPKLILPQATSRTYLRIVNVGSAVMWVENGCARATATISGGVVTGFTILNGGFAFTRPPIVLLKGGGGPVVAAPTAAAWDGRGQIDQWAVPTGANTTVTPATYNQPAQAHAVLTSGVVSSIVIDNPGRGYVNPPEVSLANDPLDPFGCADPSAGSGSGIQLAATGGAYELNGTFCHTNAIAVYAATATSFFVEYAP